ncbi:MAG TPA: ABC transporter permease [Alphaproteobacteria bacterium]|nr:ABC transporter permease [Alphaproteobacteria bacterium]
MSARFFLTKILRAVLTLLLVVSFVFIILRISGDPTDILLPDDASQDTIEFYRAQWGLDKPLYEQYFTYLANVLQGNFGESLRDHRDALQVVIERVPATLQLGFTALFMALLIGVPLGIYAALHRNSMADRLTMSFAVLGYSMPNYFLGILMIMLFAMNLQWLPSSGSATFWHAIMPVMTLALASPSSSAGALARFARSARLEVLSQSYMRTAKAKGAPYLRRIAWHAVPNAAIPIVTILGFKIGDLIAGAVVVEVVFAWPGIGRLLAGSVALRDLPVVQALFIIIATTMVLSNLAVDLIYGWLDPRVRGVMSGKAAA